MGTQHSAQSPGDTHSMGRPRRLSPQLRQTPRVPGTPHMCFSNEKAQLHSHHDIEHQSG